MSLEIIEGNSVTYNTELYKKYTLYLISEYQKMRHLSEPIIKYSIKVLKLDECLYFENQQQRFLKGIDTIINKLNELLDDHIASRYDITKIFNVMDWEEILRGFYSKINKLQLEIKESNIFDNNTVSIDTFFRKLKLEKLDENIRHI